MPMKKPNTTPIIVVVISLILSFGFLENTLWHTITQLTINDKAGKYLYYGHLQYNNKPAASRSRFCHNFLTIILDRK